MKIDEKYKKLAKEYEDFSYIVAHDLQAPIRQLQGFTDIILGELGEDLTPMQQSYKDMIDHVAKEANLSLDALLIFSRLNTDKKSYEVISLNKVAEQAWAKVQANYKTEATFNKDDLPEFYGDYSLLEQAFYQVFDNALKFQAKDNIPEVKLTLEANKDNKTTISISDNGLGIKENKHEDVFTILRSFHGDAYPGRGAGLSFAKKIIDIHDGDMWLESEVGKGTKIFFTLGKIDE